MTFPTFSAVALYTLAVVAANLSIHKFGPAAAPINAFLFIGFDLAVRDWLQTRLTHAAMVAVILGASVLTYLLAPGAQKIVFASAAAFLCAGLADWFVFSQTKGTWLKRSFTSNVAGAAVDSIVFPILAFGAILPGVMLLQFVAKAGGGALWSALVAWINRRASHTAASDEKA